MVCMAHNNAQRCSVCFTLCVRFNAVMGTHSFIHYIVTVTVTSLVTTVTNEHLQ
jgi:hypothetical protein